MKFKYNFFFIFILILIISLAACTRIDEGVIEKNSTAFTPGNIPAEMVDQMADKKAIMVGEFHRSQEHQELLFDLVKALHNQQGLDSVILQDRHAYSWIFTDFAEGRIEDGVFLENVISRYEYFLKNIREYNNQLPQDQKVSVKSGDINFQHDQFLSSLQYMRRFLNDRELVNRFLNRLRTTSDKKTVMLDFKEEIEQEQPFEVERDIDWNRRISRILEIEIDSFAPREKWQSDYVQAHRLREEVFKKIASWELSDDKRVLFNYGFNHTQKSHHFGTEKEWLGEFLSKNYPVTENKTYSITFVPMRGELRTSEGKIEQIDLMKDTSDNELLTTTAELMGEENHIFLNLNPDDFPSRENKINLHFQKIEAVPYELYDGFLLIPQVNPFK